MFFDPLIQQKQQQGWDMKKVTCINCSREFIQSPRHKNQSYCQKQACQKAKKADWQRRKMKTDPEYKASQKLSQRKWLQANTDYWKKYRKRNPEKTARNRLLQRLRNKQRSAQTSDASGDTSGMIAKMDASESIKPTKFKAIGQYWMVPVIAKMDALKVNIVAIQRSY